MNWIPTSEKLPEALGNYLVTANIKSKTDPDLDYTFVMIDHYNGCGKWTSNNSSVRKVIAWMNIPDKYEEIERKVMQNAIHNRIQAAPEECKAQDVFKV